VGVGAGAGTGAGVGGTGAGVGDGLGRPVKPGLTMVFGLGVNRTEASAEGREIVATPFRTTAA
ncbi:MAG: hypothetical protein WAQ33_13120, partial [Gaiellaceae bacterium]